MNKSIVFKFADVEVREREFCLVKAGEVLTVEPKTFRVLLFLLRNPQKLIAKEELLNAVWGDAAVTESSLTRTIAQLRRLLGDDTHNPRYIETVATVGYRFLHQVQTSEDASGMLDTTGKANDLSERDFVATLANEAIAKAAANPPEQIDTAERNPRAKAIGASGSSRLAIAVLFVGLVAVSILVFFLNRRQSTTTRQANSAMRIVPLTSLPGEAYGPAFSPDGEKFAFIWNGENPVKYDLYVQLVGGEKPLRLTHTRGGYICCASWSPDGRRIAFVRCDDNGGAVFVIPALGGVEQKLTDVTCVGGEGGYPAWTADGSSLILADRCTPEAPSGIRILLFSLKTGERRCLDSPAHWEFIDSSPILSPDQKTVAFLRTTTYNADEIYTVAVAGGKLRRLTYDNTGIWGLMWASDGHRIIFESLRSGLSRLWKVPATGGVVEPESVYPSIGAISRDGKRLAYVVPSVTESFMPEVWRIEIPSAGEPALSQKKIFDSSSGQAGGVQLSPDGREIVFESSSSGNGEIWKGNANAGDLRQLTSFEKWSAGTPRWAPDGKSIAFDVQIEAHTLIYVMDSEGRNQHSVVSGNYNNSVPSWSRDGASIYFASNRTGGWEIWARRLDTGQERRLTHHGGFTAFEAYSGKILYYSLFDGGGIWSVPVDGGEEHRVTDGLHRGYYGHFAVTEDGLYFLDAEAEPGPTIMYYSFQSHRSTPTLVLKENPVAYSPSFAASRDGRTLFFNQAHFQRSIRMAENFQ